MVQKVDGSQNLTMENRHGIRSQADDVMAIDDRNIEILDASMAEILRIKRPDERLQIAFRLWSLTLTILVNSLKSLHPEWDENRTRKEAARRISHGTV